MYLPQGSSTAQWKKPINNVADELRLKNDNRTRLRPGRIYVLGQTD